MRNSGGSYICSQLAYAIRVEIVEFYKLFVHGMKVKTSGAGVRVGCSDSKTGHVMIKMLRVRVNHVDFRWPVCISCHILIV